jgi:hypothetical protein
MYQYGQDGVGNRVYYNESRASKNVDARRLRRLLSLDSTCAAGEVLQDEEAKTFEQWKDSVAEYGMLEPSAALNARGLRLEGSKLLLNKKELSSCDLAPANLLLTLPEVRARYAAKFSGSVVLGIDKASATKQEYEHNLQRCRDLYIASDTFETYSRAVQVYTHVSTNPRSIYPNLRNRTFPLAERMEKWHYEQLEDWRKTFDIPRNPYPQFCLDADQNKCLSDLGIYLKLRVWYNGTDTDHCDAHTYHCTVPALFNRDMTIGDNPTRHTSDLSLYDAKRPMSNILENWYYGIFSNMIQCAKDKDIDTLVLPMIGLEHHVPKACSVNLVIKETWFTEDTSATEEKYEDYEIYLRDLGQLFANALYSAITRKNWEGSIVLSAASYYHGKTHSSENFDKYTTNMNILYDIIAKTIEKSRIAHVTLYTVRDFLQQEEDPTVIETGTFMHLLKGLTKQNRPTDRLMLVNGICGRRIPGFYHDVDEARLRKFSEYRMSATDNDFGRYTSIHLFGWAVTNPRLQQNIRWVP